MSWRERNEAHRIARKQAHHEANLVTGLCVAVAGGFGVIDLLWDELWPLLAGIAVAGAVGTAGVYAYQEWELARLATERPPEPAVPDDTAP